MNESPRTRPPARRVRTEAEWSDAPGAESDLPTTLTQQSGPLQSTSAPKKAGSQRRSTADSLPPKRDPFPFVVGGLISVLLVGIVAVVFLIGRLNSPNVSDVPTAGTVIGSLPGSASPPSRNPAGATAPALTQGSLLPGTVVPDEGKAHVTEGTPIAYKSYPPSSGTHYGTTADYGFTEQEVVEGKLVHSLEHGAVVLYYKPGLATDVIQKLRDAYTSLPPAKYGKVKLVITPYSKLTVPIEMAAWGYVQPFPQFEYDKIRAFYQAHVDKGPEDVP